MIPVRILLAGTRRRLYVATQARKVALTEFAEAVRGLKDLDAWRLPYLRPAEDTALCACAEVPLVRRLLWGLLAREGMRLSEALSLRFQDFDPSHGTISVERSKTRTANTWKASPGVVSAVRAVQGELPDERAVFGDLLALKTGLARVFRDDLQTAKVKRSELHDRSDVRRPIRVHDLRGTAVTLWLAAGRSEAYVQDRTGHTTSAMLARYRRAALTAAELGLGELLPLDRALGLATKGGPGSKRRPVDQPESQEKLNNTVTWPLGGMADAGDLKSSGRGMRNDATAENTPDRDARWPTKAHEEGHSGPAFGPPSSVDAALAIALERASAAGEWALVSHSYAPAPAIATVTGDSSKPAPWRGTSATLARRERAGPRSRCSGVLRERVHVRRAPRQAHATRPAHARADRR